jgi:hypothetical protein
MHFIWRFYYIPNCRHTRPLPKDKFVAIVCNAPNPMGFLINTSIRDYIKNRSYLLSSQIPISCEEYDFLDHDSYIDCSNLYPFNWCNLTSRRQRMGDNTISAIKRAVINSDTIEEMYIRLICGE